MSRNAMSGPDPRQLPPSLSSPAMEAAQPAERHPGGCVPRPAQEQAYESAAYGTPSGMVPMVLTVRFSMLAEVAHAGSEEISELLLDAVRLVSEADGTERDAVAELREAGGNPEQDARVLEEAVQLIARYLPEPGAETRQCSAYLGCLASRIRHEGAPLTGGRSPVDRQLELLAELRVIARDAEKLTRGRATEARHTLLYASQGMLRLREYVVSEQMRWTTFRAELDEIRGQLDALAGYVIPGDRTVIWNRNEIGGAGPVPGDVCMAQIQAWRREP